MSEESGRWELKVSRVPWEPTKHTLSGADYIMGIVLEIPEMYYITPDQQIAFIYIWGKGLVGMRHDFTHLDQEQRALFVHYVRRDLSG